MAILEEAIGIGIDARKAVDGARQYNIAINSIAQSSGMGASAVDKMMRSIKQFETISNIQRNITSQFKTVDFAGEGLDKIKRQMEARQEMEDRLYNATHSGLEQQLKAHDDYYAELTGKFSGNEGLLTKIIAASSAERQQIIADSAVQSEKSIQRMVRTYLKAGIYTYAATSVINSGTEMLKAARNGENMYAAFAKGLPIIGNFSKAISGLVDELWGYNAVAEKLAMRQELTIGFNKINTELDQSIQIQSASPNERAGVQAKIWYDNKMKELDELDKLAQKAAGEYADKIGKLQNSLKVAPVKEGGWSMFGSDYSGNSNVIKSQLQEQIAALNVEKSKIEDIEAARSKAAENYELTVENQRKERITGITDSLKQQVETFGMSAGEIELYKAKLTGANEAEIAYIQTLSDKLKVMEKEKEATKARNEIQQSFRTLELERSLIGKTNDARERAVEMMKLQTEAEKAYGVGTAETNQVLADYEQQLIKLQDARKLERIARGIGDAFATTFEDMVLGAKSASEAIRALAQDVARLMMRQMVTQQISDWATVAITAGVSSFTGAAVGTGAAGTTAGTNGGTLATGGDSSIMSSMWGGVNAQGRHDGGRVGYDSPSFYRNVDSSMFRNAPRFHEGLLPQEFPAILKRGETVRTEEQEAALSKSNGGSNVRIVNILDPKFAVNAMSGSDGEKVVMNHISKNSTSIKGMLA